MELDVDSELYRRLERRAEENGFDSAEEYSLVVLRTVLDELEGVDGTGSDGRGGGDDGDDGDVRDRLEDLGYL